MFLPRVPRHTTASAALLVLLLASCSANQQPIRVVEYTSTTESNEQLEERISRLEEAEERMRKQYEAMGETLTWLRGEIRALRSHHRIQYKPLPQQEINATHSLKQSDVKINPEDREQATAETTPAPHVAPLSEKDLAISPENSTTTRNTNTEPEVKSTNTGVEEDESIYLVHLASYKSTAPLQQGWQSLKQKTPQAMVNTTPCATAFQDQAGKEWVRLSAGPFSTRAEAKQKCEQIKTEGGWCDTITSTDANTSCMAE